ncbi:hypothetical protein ACH40F_43780 [Streptomyces sp. NPDC020794]|uniref:hypothetical protein n=1 Tax=unclassified Streptomyces TaxID=2593676 RepID=UPI0036E83B62
MKITKFTPGLLTLAATGALLALAAPAHADIDVTNSGTNTVFNDKSVKVANFDEETSVSQTFGNDGFFGH